MRYRLRTLLIAAALAPPGVAGLLWLTKMPSGLLKFCIVLTVGTVLICLLAVSFDALEKLRARS